MAAADAACADEAEGARPVEEIEAPLVLLAQLLASSLEFALDRRVLPQPPLPRLALSPEEAARALGVSRDFFDGHVLPELRVVRRGRRRLVPLRELERWLEQSAGRALAGERSCAAAN